MASGKKVRDFRPASRNANKHTARGMGALQKSIQSDGWIGAMTTAADGEMIAGSARIETVAQVWGTDAEPIVVESDGTRPVLVVRTDIPNADDKRAQRLALADNRVHEIDMSWDVEVLAGFDADVLGDLWTPEELSDLGQQWADEQRGKQEDAGAQIDKAEELRVKWGVESGQLWQLGEHRLICGDCTDAATVAKVMGGEQYDFLITSPPYNVGVQYDEHDDTQVDWIKYEVFLRSVLDAALSRLKQGRAIAWNIGTSPKTHHVKQHILIESYGLTYYRQMVWKKVGVPVPLWFNTIKNPVARQFTPNYQHEVVLIFTNGNLERGATIEIDKLFENDVFEFGQQFATTDIPECKTRSGAQSNLDRKSMKAHPAAFPVRIPQMFITHLSGPGEIVYEPFLGSGTTLIACERLGRKCRAVEISPAYCAVALERWAQTTGKTPILANGA